MCFLIYLYSKSKEPNDLPDITESLDNFVIQSDSSASSLSPGSPRDLAQTRQLRQRAVNQLESTMHKTKRRIISKPRKLNAATLSSGASENLIKKLYLNKKMTKLRPTNLETIFETPKESKNNTFLYTSAVRFKRSLDFKNYQAGLPKQIIQNRRKKIKKMLGGGSKVKKISMSQFLDHFQSLQGDLEFEEMVTE